MGWLRRILGARSREEMEGLTLVDPRWELAGVPDAARFFRSLGRLVPSGALLFLEGGQHPAALRSYLEAHGTSASRRPALGTIWPREPVFCVRAVPDVLRELATMSEHLAEPEVCTHLHVVANERLLLSGYDAFSDPFYVSSDVPEEAVQQFCAEANCSYRRCRG